MWYFDSENNLLQTDVYKNVQKRNSFVNRRDFSTGIFNHHIVLKGAPLFLDYFW